MKTLIVVVRLSGENFLPFYGESNDKKIGPVKLLEDQ